MTQEQYSRLIDEDFPWLWAIRNSWGLGQRQIIPKSAGQGLQELLETKTKVNNKWPDMEIWVRFGSSSSPTGNPHVFMQVKRVWATSEVTWADRITYVLRRVEIFNIVAIPIGNGLAEEVTVYRQKQKLQINQLIARVARW